MCIVSVIVCSCQNNNMQLISSLAVVQIYLAVRVSLRITACLYLIMGYIALIEIVCMHG